MESFPKEANTGTPDANDKFNDIISREFGVNPGQPEVDIQPFGSEFMRDAPAEIKGFGSVKNCGTVTKSGAIDNKPDGAD